MLCQLLQLGKNYNEHKNLLLRGSSVLRILHCPFSTRSVGWESSFVTVSDGENDNYEVSAKSKGKVVPVLPLTEHHAMKAYWGIGGTAPPIL
jgi:hypothetical protein